MHFIFSDRKRQTSQIRSDQMMSSQAPPFPLESLPEPVFDQMLSYLTYHELALLRRVDRKFNSTIMRLLNQGFRSAERFHAKCLKVSY